MEFKDLGVILFSFLIIGLAAFLTYQNLKDGKFLKERQDKRNRKGKE